MRSAMNAVIAKGKFNGDKKTYLTMNGLHFFWFEFIKKGDHFDIYCNKHPSLNGHSSSVSKTHLYSSGKICFVSGKEPRSELEAQKRAKEWAEYIAEYRKNGRAQS